LPTENVANVEVQTEAVQPLVLETGCPAKRARHSEKTSVQSSLSCDKTVKNDSVLDDSVLTDLVQPEATPDCDEETEEVFEVQTEALVGIDKVNKLMTIPGGPTESEVKRTKSWSEILGGEFKTSGDRKKKKENEDGDKGGGETSL
jgi:hypothetical protein